MAYHALNVDYVNPFIESIVSVFRTMLKMELRRGELYLKKTSQPALEISGVIGLSGASKGMVLLSMSREVAFQATSTLAAEAVSTINADVIDAVGELTNMVAGGAKGRLETLKMSISLPTVIVGKNHVVSFPTGSTPLGIPFESPAGPIALEVSLVDAA